MVSEAYPAITNAVLNDNFLTLLSTQLTKFDTPEDKQLCLMALNILSWILSFVSCSENEEEANIQKKIIFESSHLKTSFERAIVLISSHYDNVEVVNLCLFVLMEQSATHLVVGRSAVLIDALVRCMDHNSILSKNIHPKNIPVQNERWKQPIIACSALCTLLEQIPDEILKRHRYWSVDVFLLLVQSFSSSAADTQDKDHGSSSSSSSSKNSNDNKHSNSGGVSSVTSNNDNTTSMKRSAPNPGNGTDSSLSLSLSGFYADPDARLLPLSVSTVRILGRLTPGQCTPLISLALGSHTPAMAHIW